MHFPSTTMSKIQNVGERILVNVIAWSPEWSSGIHLRPISQKMHKIAILDLILSFTNLRLQPHFPGANELRYHSTLDSQDQRHWTSTGNNVSTGCWYYTLKHLNTKTLLLNILSISTAIYKVFSHMYLKHYKKILWLPNRIQDLS